jgi:hypothetical protein
VPEMRDEYARDMALATIRSYVDARAEGQVGEAVAKSGTAIEMRTFSMVRRKESGQPHTAKAATAIRWRPAPWLRTLRPSEPHPGILMDGPLKPGQSLSNNQSRRPVLQNMRQNRWPDRIMCGEGVRRELARGRQCRCSESSPASPETHCRGPARTGQARGVEGHVCRARGRVRATGPELGLLDSGLGESRVTARLGAQVTIRF